MSKIHTLSQSIRIASLIHKSGKKLVLAGGCFDILHLGHIQFLEEAKKHGDLLMVLVESDATVRLLKGENRPINQQKNRAKVLAALCAVDIVCLLPQFTTHAEYDSLVLRLKPAIIATTSGDPLRKHKEKQAHLVQGKVIRIQQKKDQSTTKLAKVLLEHYQL